MAFVSSASAQARTPGPPIEASFGVGLATGSDLGSANANLRGRADAPFLLFATSSRFGSSIPLEARLTFPFTRRYAIEGRAAFLRPELQTLVSQDVEGAPPLTVSETVDQFHLDGTFVVTLDELQLRGFVPFVSGGAGYVGQVHEGYTLIEHGVSYRGGGGVKYLLGSRNRGFIRGVGIRVDAALVFLTEGVEADGGTSSHFEAAGGVYLRF